MKNNINFFELRSNSSKSHYSQNEENLSTTSRVQFGGNAGNSTNPKSNKIFNKDEWLKALSDSNVLYNNKPKMSCSEIRKRNSPYSPSSKLQKLSPKSLNEEVFLERTKINQLVLDDFDLNWSKTPTGSETITSTPNQTSDHTKNSTQNCSVNNDNNNYTSSQFSTNDSSPLLKNVFIPHFVGNTELNFLGSGMVEVAPDLFLQSDYYLMTNIPALGTVVSPVYTAEEAVEIRNGYDDNINQNYCSNKKVFLEEARNRIQEVTTTNSNSFKNSCSDGNSNTSSTNPSNEKLNAYKNEQINDISPKKCCFSDNTYTTISGSNRQIFPIEEISETDQHTSLELQKYDCNTYRANDNNDKIVIINDKCSDESEEYQTKTLVDLSMNAINLQILPNQIVDTSTEQKNEMSLRKALKLKEISSNYLKKFPMAEENSLAAAFVKPMTTLNETRYVIFTNKGTSYNINDQNKCESNMQEMNSQSVAVCDIEKTVVDNSLNLNNTDDSKICKNNSCFSLNWLGKIFRKKKSETVINVSKTYFVKISNRKTSPKNSLKSAVFKEKSISLVE